MIADKKLLIIKHDLMIVWNKKKKKNRSILLTLPSTSMNTLSSTSLILQLSVNNSSSVKEMGYWQWRTQKYWNIQHMILV